MNYSRDFSLPMPVRQSANILLRFGEEIIKTSLIDAMFASGADRSVLINAAVLDGDAERPSGLLLHFVETTEHKPLEARFAQSQKMQAVGQLAGKSRTISITC